MKHQAIAIEFESLLGRVLDDSDTPWRDVIGYQHTQLDQIEQDLKTAEGDDEVALLAESERIEAELIKSLEGTWWYVSWPEHVCVPRFNSDATYHQCRSREEAIDGAAEYGA